MIKPSPQDSVAFLQDVNPDGPWNLVAIEPDGRAPLVGKSFMPDQTDAVLAWLTMHGDRNNYYTLNPIMSMIDTKPSRADIKELGFLHVDLDPRAGEPVADEQARIEKLISVMDPKPTWVVFSGGGYQCIWKLDDPLEINGKAEAYDEAKLYNLQLEQLFDADNCHNVDRIMRLPGTVNHPSARKKAKGRVPALAYVSKRNDVSYPIKKFIKCQMVQSADQGLTKSKNSVQVSENVARLPDLDVLEKAGVNAHCRVLIAKGHDPDEPHKYEDRSDMVWYCVCEMIRSGVDDDTIFAVITDKDWGVSAHVLDQPRPRDYAIRQIERAHDYAIEPKMGTLNDTCAIVMIDGKMRVLMEDTDPMQDRPVIRFIGHGDFKNFHGNEYVTMENKNGKGSTSTPLGLWWLSNPASRKYDGVVFAPGRADIGNRYNLWKGFAYEARPGNCDLFLDHVRANICRGKKVWFDYLIGWMARLVQHPDRPGETALVFRGKPGVGKGFFANQLGKLLGRHFLPVSNSDHIFGRFNSHLQETVLLFADECFGVSDKKQEGMLKALITESTIVMERKGVDARTTPNFIHLIMASNEDFVVPIGNFDRRFFVLDIGDEKRKNRDYFGAIVAQLEDGGYEALLNYLLTYDIEDYDVTDVPKTAAHAEQAAHTMDPTSAWWHDILQSGDILYHDSWPSTVWNEELHDSYVEHMRTHGGRHVAKTNVQLGKFMKKVLPLPPGKRQAKQQSSAPAMIRQADGTQVQKGRPYYTMLLSLEECRKAWDVACGQVIWDEPTEVSEIVVVDEGPF